MAKVQKASVIQGLGAMAKTVPLFVSEVFFSSRQTSFTIGFVLSVPKGGLEAKKL